MPDQSGETGNSGGRFRRNQGGGDGRMGPAPQNDNRQEQENIEAQTKEISAHIKRLITDLKKEERGAMYGAREFLNTFVNRGTEVQLRFMLTGLLVLVEGN